MTDQMERPREFVYPPRPTAGVIGRFSGIDVAFFTVAVLLMVIGFRVLSEGWGYSVALWCVAALLALTPLPRPAGRSLTHFLRPALGAVRDKITGRGVYRGAAFAPDELLHRMDLPGDLAGLRMVSVPARDGVTRIGLIVDESNKKRRTATAAALTFSESMLTADEATRAIRMDGWESVLESFCQRKSGIGRWQLMLRTAPDVVNQAARHLDTNASPMVSSGLALANARMLVTGPAAAAERHEVYIVIEFDLEELAGEIERLDKHWSDDAIGAAVRDQLLEIEEDLRGEKIQSPGWLRPGQYATLIRTQLDPDSLPLYDMTADPRRDMDERLAGPAATERSWKFFRHDSAVSQTMWVHELPRRTVGAGWLRPVLTQTGVRRTVTLVAEPMDAITAQRQVQRQAINADSAVHFKASKQLFVSARSRRESRAAQQQDEALSAGDGMFRYHMFVTVTAPDEAVLSRQVLAVRRRLTKAFCESVVLYGEQDQAFFAAVLPLARGLTPLRRWAGV